MVFSLRQFYFRKNNFAGLIFANYRPLGTRKHFFHAKMSFTVFDFVLQVQTKTDDADYSNDMSSRANE